MSDNTYRGDALLPMKVVRERTGLGPSAIYDRMAKGQFPKAIPLSARCVRWSQRELDEWIEARKAER